MLVKRKKKRKSKGIKNAAVILLESFLLVARGLPAFSAERRGSGRKSEKWIGKMSEGGAAPQPSPLPVRKNSIHHFHVSVSRLTLPIARSVATLTQRIDEVQAGVASRAGDGQTRCGAWCRAGGGEGGRHLVKVATPPAAPVNGVHRRCAHRIENNWTCTNANVTSCVA